MRIFLGIDAGTTSIKAALFDPSGQLLGLARKEYTLETPAPNRVELDPEVYWQSCCAVVRQALGQSQVSADEVKSLCISSQGETFIPVDSQGMPTHKAIVWLDNRAAGQAEKIAARFGVESVYRRTGQPEIAPTWPACKILWLRERRPRCLRAKPRAISSWKITCSTG